MRTRSLMATIVAGTLLLAAAPTFAQSPAPAGPLAGTAWGVTAIGAVGGTGATLIFTEDGAGGFAGCNNFNADYTADATALSFGPIMTTMMACEQPVMDFETEYLTALASVASYTTDGKTLTLTDASGAEALTYAAQAPDSIEGEWLVTGYNDGTGVVPPADGTSVVLTFNPDGTVSGNAGCNQFFGGYGVEGSTITVGPLMSTMMACEDAVMAQEVAVIGALEGATTWQITATGAELRGANDTLQLSLSSLTPTLM